MTENRISVSTSGDRMVIEVYEDDQRIAGAAGKDWADTFAILARGFAGPEADATDVLTRCRQSVIDLYAAFPDIALDIPIARRMFNEEAGELQEAAVQLDMVYSIVDELNYGSEEDDMADRIAYVREETTKEAADALYTLIGLIVACGISPNELNAAVAEKCHRNDAKRPDNGYVSLNGKIQKAVAP